MTIHYVAFPLSDALQSKSNRFLEAASAKDRETGALFTEAILELTDIVIDTLLLKPLQFSNISSVAERLVKACASTGAKVSGMLSGKIYKGASIPELGGVAEVWQEMLRNFDDGRGWRISAALDGGFAKELEILLQERGSGPEYHPKDVMRVVKAYETLADVVINDIFLAPTRKVKMGMVTEALLKTGVASVKSAIHAVMHNVIGKLPPRQLAEYVDYTLQFYVKA